ncbi:MAG: CoA transferase [Dehalococcoidia bacterium]|nr:CoA transferase [Dehalococcoidia bacterium]
MLALEGIRILDLSRQAPGPYCTMILGDMGAEVVKIERAPGKGEDLIKNVPANMRGWIISKNGDVLDPAYSRNKKSIALNLRSEEGREIIYRLAKEADVVVEGFRPGVAKRLSVDYETLKKINSRIVYCSISGYGQEGPYRNMPGHDINYISMAGAQGLIGNPDGSPSIPLNLIADYAAGSLQAAIGILTALLAREKTGKGQYVDVSMLDGVVSLLTMMAHHYFSTGEVLERGKSWINGGVPYYNNYRTREGKYISIGCVEPHFWENLCRVLGREDFIPHQGATGEKKEEIYSSLEEIFLTRTRDEWFDLLAKENVCVGKVYAMDEVISDPQVVQQQMIIEVDDGDGGKTKQVGIIPKLSDTPGMVRGTAPVIGEHTREILLSLGYDGAKIEKLRQDGVVYVAEMSGGS